MKVMVVELVIASGSCSFLNCGGPHDSGIVDSYSC